MSYIKIHDLRKEFDIPAGIEVAVDDINLEIEEGEFVTLVGPSGCGKTTTLRCIAGLETPTSGAITVDGTDLTEVSPQDRDMAMVFQRTALYPHMTAQQNIEYPLKLAGISRDERTEKAKEAARIVRVADLLDKYPGEISGGQQQRVAISRAIVRDPIAFLMDEPMSDLDEKLKREMRKEIGKIHKKLDATIIYVTHDQEEAMTMSDKIAVMNDGHIEQFDAPVKVFREPVNVFVAQFIGSPEINLLSGKLLEHDDDRVRVELTNDYNIEFAYELFDESKAGDDVLVGFRPRRTTLRPPNAGGIEVSVSIQEPFGDEVQMYLDGPEDELRCVLEAGKEVDEGEPARLQVLESGIFLFEATTGETFARGDQSSSEFATITVPNLPM